MAHSSPPFQPPLPNFGPNPQTIFCTSCHTQTTTMIKAESATKTHIIAALLCLVGCCCIPYCCDSCKTRNHYCRNCGAFLGSYSS